MTILRMDNVGVVVDDLEAAIAFFVELGLEPEGEAAVRDDGWIASAPRASSSRWPSSSDRAAVSRSGPRTRAATMSGSPSGAPDPATAAWAPGRVCTSPCRPEASSHQDSHQSSGGNGGRWAFAFLQGGSPIAASERRCRSGGQHVLISGTGSGGCLRPTRRSRAPSCGGRGGGDRLDAARSAERRSSPASPVMPARIGDGLTPLPQHCHAPRQEAGPVHQVAQPPTSCRNVTTATRLTMPMVMKVLSTIRAVT